MKPFIITASGKQFDFLTPRPESICITDIAHALSLIPRFGGHVTPFYSVAQHSVLVASLHPTLSALMHDAHEAYVGDVPTPLKSLCPSYQRIEIIAQNAVANKYGLHHDLVIKDADRLALLAEARDLMGAPPWVQPELYKVGSIKQIVPWPSSRAKRLFLQVFIILAEKQIAHAILTCHSGR